MTEIEDTRDPSAAMPIEMHATDSLAERIARQRFEDMPPAVVEAAKTVILDGVANLVAGSTQPLVSKVHDYVREHGGREEATVACANLRTSTFNAAFANGVALHCLDFEVQGYPPSHGTSSILPAALALGEWTTADGRALLNAFVAGWETQAVLRSASARAALRGFHPPGVYGPLASAAAAAASLGLDKERTATALGIAASRTGGLFANVGTMVKSTHPGNAARMGVEAALLSQRGFESCPTVLEAPNGYVSVFFDGAFDWNALSLNRHDLYHLVDPGFNIKRYPAEIYMQWVIEAVTDLRQRHSLQSDDVELIEVTVPEALRDLSRPNPSTGLEGKFSFEYCAAVALALDDVDIDAFSDQKRRDPVVERALARVVVRTEPEGSRDLAQFRTKVRITRRSGPAVAGECRSYRGSIANPMSERERRTKVERLLQRQYPDQRSRQVIEAVTHLERLGEVRELMALLG